MNDIIASNNLGRTSQFEHSRDELVLERTNHVSSKVTLLDRSLIINKKLNPFLPVELRPRPFTGKLLRKTLKNHGFCLCVVHQSCVFSSLGRVGAYCGRPMSVVCQHLLNHCTDPEYFRVRDHRASLDETWQGCSLGTTLQKMSKGFNSTHNSACHDRKKFKKKQTLKYLL